MLLGFVDSHTHFVSGGFQLFGEGNSREKSGLIGLWTYGACKFALKLIGITRKTPNPHGGLIGILKDEAISLVYKDAHL